MDRLQICRQCAAEASEQRRPPLAPDRGRPMRTVVLVVLLVWVVWFVVYCPCSSRGFGSSPASGIRALVDLNGDRR